MVFIFQRAHPISNPKTIPLDLKSTPERVRGAPQLRHFRKSATQRRQFLRHLRLFLLESSQLRNRNCNRSLSYSCLDTCRRDYTLQQFDRAVRAYLSVILRKQARVPGTALLSPRFQIATVRSLVEQILAPAPSFSEFFELRP